MCGIFTLLNQDKELTNNFISEQAAKGQHRGPDNCKLDISEDKFLAFYRLAINGLDEKSNQPLKYNNKVLICNGEIYNYKKLYELLNITPKTNSDCEVIIYLYEKYGIEYTLGLLDGVYAFVLIDNDINRMYVARDAFGVRPLFIMNNNKEKMIGFSSEMKQLNIFTEDSEDFQGQNRYFIKPFSPGHVMTLEYTSNIWQINALYQFYNYNLTRITPNNDEIDEQYILSSIHEIFTEAVFKRVSTTDRPIACLLSGGLDSSIVAALISKMVSQPLETYSIGLEGAEDLKYARKVAKHINSNHTEVIVTEDDFFAYIPNVIKNIESYDTTTVRASVGNMLLAQYISETSNAKVIFNGDGSDELMGGYLYMNHAPDALEFDCECKRLLNNLYLYDVLRSDRSVSVQGLEPRTPFLDRDYVTFYLSIPAQYRFSQNKIIEKNLFRKAFDKGYLPDEVLWRQKEAFSDGVSKVDRSWYKIIEEKVIKQKDYKFDVDVEYLHNPPESLEQLYYRNIYNSHYKNQEHLIPYFWMPKYIEATDSSARSLDIYNIKSIPEDDINVENLEDEINEPSG